MQRRYIVSLVFMLAVASVLYLVMSKNKPLEVILEKATSVIIKSENKKMVIPSLKSVSEGNKNNSKVAALEKEDSLFPEYQLLNKQELEKYKVVPAQIVKYFDRLCQC